MRILLAVDGSKFSDAAIQAVIRQGGPEPVKVYVLHVVETVYSHVAPYAEVVRARDIEEADAQLVNHGREIVDRAGRLLGGTSYEVHTAVESGDPGPSIVEFARNHGCDLVVLGSHGRTGLDRFLMGSVAEYVARQAPCSVEIVRVSRHKATDLPLPSP